MKGINFYKRPRLKNPILIAAWPGMGEVAFKAARFLVDKLPAEEFASIDSADFFYLTGGVIKEGIIATPQLPYNKFYFWKNKNGKNDLIIFISNAQPDLSCAEEYCRRILLMRRYFDINMVISLAAMPYPIDHLQTPQVWLTVTSQKLKKGLLGHNLKMMSEGQISGMNGLFLGIAKNKGVDGFCLLGEIPIYTIQVENPRSSYALLDRLSRILEIPIKLNELKDQADVMERQINQLIEYLKLSPQHLPPIGEEEIETIKKSLGEYSKLPQSVRIKIEKLFRIAKRDISKANELKLELDKWNVYKEYEDRFLDLFKKPKEKGN